MTEKQLQELNKEKSVIEHDIQKLQLKLKRINKEIEECDKKIVGPHYREINKILPEWKPKDCENITEFFFDSTFESSNPAEYCNFIEGEFSLSYIKYATNGELSESGKLLYDDFIIELEGKYEYQTTYDNRDEPFIQKSIKLSVNNKKIEIEWEYNSNGIREILQEFYDERVAASGSTAMYNEEHFQLLYAVVEKYSEKWEELMKVNDDH